MKININILSIYNYVFISDSLLKKKQSGWDMKNIRDKKLIYIAYRFVKKKIFCFVKLIKYILIFNINIYRYWNDYSSACNIFFWKNLISLSTNWHFHPRWLCRRHISLLCLGILPSSFTCLFGDRNDSSFISSDTNWNLLIAQLAHPYSILFSIYFVS